MKDIIADRLNKISDLNDRRVLKNILLDVYENITIYNMEMYENLEKRIYDEIEDPLDKCYVYCSLDYLENIDPVSDFLHPMIPEDLKANNYNFIDINEEIRAGKEIVLATVFMKCDMLIITEMLNSNRNYNGYIKTSNDLFEVKVKIRKCFKYVEEIEKLYRAFQHNGIVWNTINCPYAYKFVDIVLVSDFALTPGDNITEITMDLAEYEQYKIPNVIPIWNIKNVEVQDKSFPMPARDRINYDHLVSLIDLGVQNGYLVDSNNSNFLYCKRNETELNIVSQNNEQNIWNLMQIEDFSNNRKRGWSYELLSNKRNLGFIGRYSSLKSVKIHTRSEISRVIEMYDFKGTLKFQNIEIVDEYEKEVQTVDYNSFIDDNIRDDKYKKIMMVKFKANDRENYLIYDKVSFLTSELQILFPEYKCIGELV